MADPRDDMTELELMNAGVPRITVTPEPPSLGKPWGESGRLFEPDLSPAEPPAAQADADLGARLAGQYRGGGRLPPDAAPTLPVERYPLGSLPRPEDLPDLSRPPQPWQGQSPRVRAAPTTPEEDFGRALGQVGQPAPTNRVYNALSGAVQKALDVVGPAVPPELRPKVRGAAEAANIVNPATALRDYTQAAGQGKYGEAALNLAGLIPGEALAAGAAKIGGLVTPAMFLGVGARGADKLALARAETMEKAGARAEDIRRQTGWERGSDGQWMYEISDAGARYKGDVDSIARNMFDRTWPHLKGEFGERRHNQKTQIARSAAQDKISGLTPTYLEDVLHHPELFLHEPRAAKVPTSQDPTMWGSGSYQGIAPGRPKGEIKYREEDLSRTELERGRTLDNILHETSHFLDNLYGMPRGASPNLDLTKIPGTPANKIYNRMVIEKPPSSDLTIEGKRNYDLQMRQAAADEAYNRSAGEIKAELVTDRRNLTPEQRQAIAPQSQMRWKYPMQIKEYNQYRPKDAPAPPTIDQPQMSVRPGSILGAPAILKGSDIPVNQLLELGHIPQGTNQAWTLRYDPTTGAPSLGAAPGHGFSSLATGKPVEDMVAGYTGAPRVIPARNFDPADLEGKTLVLGVTDRTKGVEGAGVNYLGGRSIDPVRQEAGVSFPTMHAGKNTPDVPKGADPLFASVSKGAAGRITNTAKAVQEAGGDPYFTTINMAHGSGDSSKQVAQSALRVAKQSELKEGAVEAIDKAMAQMSSGLSPPPRPYPGFASDIKVLEKWLDDAGLPYRSAFVKALDTGKVQKTGVHDIGEVRFANTDPRLYSTPTGSGGLVVGRMRPEIGYRETDLHSNYPYTIFGQRGEIGALPGSAPFALVAPDLHRLLLPRTRPKEGTSFANNPNYYVMQGIPGGVPPTQKVTPEVVDYLSRWFEKHPQGWSIAGGVAGTGAIGSLVAPNRQEEVY